MNNKRGNVSHYPPFDRLPMTGLKEMILTVKYSEPADCEMVWRSPSDHSKTEVILCAELVRPGRSDDVRSPDAKTIDISIFHQSRHIDFAREIFPANDR